MKTFVIVTLGTLLLCSSGQCGPNDAEWNPPARYDHEYSGKLTERYLPQEQVVKECKKLFRKFNFRLDSVTSSQRGCSAGDRNTCTIIIIDKTYKLATPNSVRRHEIGHCNGWGFNHEE